jgi:hypothetical protein
MNEMSRSEREDLQRLVRQVFRSLLSPEDITDIEAGDIHPKTLGAYARVFAEGMRQGP